MARLRCFACVSRLGLISVLLGALCKISRPADDIGFEWANRRRKGLMAIENLLLMISFVFNLVILCTCRDGNASVPMFNLDPPSSVEELVDLKEGHANLLNLCTIAYNAADDSDYSCITYREFGDALIVHNAELSAVYLNNATNVLCGIHDDNVGWQGMASMLGWSSGVSPNADANCTLVYDSTTSSYGQYEGVSPICYVRSYNYPLVNWTSQFSYVGCYPPDQYPDCVAHTCSEVRQSYSHQLPDDDGAISRSRRAISRSRAAKCCKCTKSSTSAAPSPTTRTTCSSR